MDPNNIVDDIWNVIFDDVDHDTLEQLSLVCRRFKDLATKPLLREVRWRDPHRVLCNMAGWERSYSHLLIIVRKLVYGLPFEFSGLNSWGNPKDMFLYDRSIFHLRRFTSLHDIHFTKTVLTPHLYDILRQIPSLRTLSITDCSFSPLYTTFRDMVYWRYGVALNNQDDSDFPWSEIPIRHLSLHRITMRPENDLSHFNPLHLIKSSTLQSLDITWSQGFSGLYTGRHWVLSQLTTLNVTLPLKTQEQAHSLMRLVHHCTMKPRIKLDWWRQNSTEEQLRLISLPLGIWHCKGPFPMPRYSDVDTGTKTLTHVIMIETVAASRLLDVLEALPSSITHLEVRLKTWDMEVLYAIRFLFPKIRSFIVRYGTGNLPPDLFLNIGANIIFELYELRAFKLLEDPTCILPESPDASSPTGNNGSGGGGGGGTLGHGRGSGRGRGHGGVSGGVRGGRGSFRTGLGRGYNATSSIPTPVQISPHLPPSSSQSYRTTYSFGSIAGTSSDASASIPSSLPTPRISILTPKVNKSSYGKLAFQLQKSHDQFERFQDVQQARFEEMRRAREEELQRARVREEWKRRVEEARNYNLIASSSVSGSNATGRGHQQWPPLQQPEDVSLSLRHRGVDPKGDIEAREEIQVFSRAVSDGTLVGDTASFSEGRTMRSLDEDMMGGKGKGKAKANESGIEGDDTKTKRKNSSTSFSTAVPNTVSNTAPNANESQNVLRGQMDEFIRRMRERNISVIPKKLLPSANISTTAATANTTLNTDANANTNRRTSSKNDTTSSATHIYRSPSNASHTSLTRTTTTTMTTPLPSLSPAEPPLASQRHSHPNSSYNPSPEAGYLDMDELSDYLYAWSRFCRNLRYVEIGAEVASAGVMGGGGDEDGAGGGRGAEGGTAKNLNKNNGWSRRFEGDGWVFGRNWNEWDE